MPLASHTDAGVASDTLAIFDFDRTLVCRDSFRLFANLAARSPLERFALFLLAAACKLRWIDNRRYKEWVLRRVWQPRTADERLALQRRMLDAMKPLVIESAMTRLREHLARGEQVAIFSASPQWYLAPFVERLSPDISVFGSVIEEGAGTLRVHNLFRESKAQKARIFIETRGPKHVWVYTDHWNDLDLMRLGERVVLVHPSARTLNAVAASGMAFEVLAS